MISCSVPVSRQLHGLHDCNLQLALLLCGACDGLLLCVLFWILGKFFQLLTDILLQFGAGVRGGKSPLEMFFAPAGIIEKICIEDAQTVADGGFIPERQNLFQCFCRSA
jgi:hypothetical protein